jgi:hypothetical protein
VGFDVIDQLMIRFFAFVRYRRKNGSTMKITSAIHRLPRKPMIPLGGIVQYSHRVWGAHETS